MKYWVLSVKLSEIANQKHDSKFDLKAKLIFFFVILWIVISVSVATYIYINNMTDTTSLNKNIWISISIITAIPPALILLFYISAIVRVYQN